MPLPMPLADARQSTLNYVPTRPDAPRGSHAGAWGEGVAELTKRAIALSCDRLELCRARDPDLEELFGLVLEVGRKPERDIELAEAIEDALDEFDAKRSADRRRGLH